jgi:hypothetical protein
MTFRLGLRLAVAGGRVSQLRLAVTAVGVGIGVTLLLLILTGQSAVQGRAERSGWQSADSETAADAPDAALFLSVTDYHDGALMTRAYVAALGPRPPVPPGLDRLPEPGEVAASPALRRLLESTPDDQLADRYPGRVTATIGDAGLAHRDELVAIVGRTPDQLRDVQSESLHTVRGFDSLPSGYAFALVVRVLLLVGAVLLVVPVVIFIVMATRVAAAQREQRIAAIRLAGATRMQAAVVAGVETGLAAAVGSAVGWVGYEVGRRVLAATVVFQGGPFFVDDVAVGRWSLLLVLVGVPVLAALTTVVTLRRAQLGPLAASRRAHRSPPSAWLALPLAIGLGGQLVAIPLGGVLGRDDIDALAPPLVVLTVLGFVMTGPWLCLLAGRGVARVSRRAPGLIAARRIAADPRATFRAVSGVVLAAFTVTYSASVVDVSGGDANGYGAGAGDLRPGVVEVFVNGLAGGPDLSTLSEQAVVTRFDSNREVQVVESCAALARVVRISCSSADPPGRLHASPELAASDLPILSVYVPTDGSAAAEDRVRTEAANLVPNAIIHTHEDLVDVDARYLGDVAELVRVFWHFVLVVAACSLTVGMVAGVIERRRPLALLRASGLRLGELRQVVLLETVAAMLVTAAAGVGLGLGASYSLARFGDLDWAWPDAGVFTMVGMGVLAALVLSMMTLPLLDAATRHDAVRYE